MAGMVELCYSGRMWTRIATGVVLAPLLLWLLIDGPVWSIVWLFTIACGIALNELMAMAMPGRLTERWATIVAGVGIVLLALSGVRQAALWIPSVALIVPALALLARPQPLHVAARRLGIMWGGLLYIALPMTIAAYLAMDWRVIILILGTIWCGDTGAYFVGRAFGRHKLYPLVSPKKTIEGAVGGLVASAAWSAIWISAYIPSISLGTAIGVGALAGAFGQAGDLVESALKRSCGVKDSGTILPGHGGLLDRVDGVLFAVPLYLPFFG